VKRCSLKRAGYFLLGPRLGNSPVRSIVQCLAKRDGTDDFYCLKMLTIEEPGHETQDDKQGKMLLHTEYSLLSLLHNQDGVVHHHGLFQDEFTEEISDRDSSGGRTERVRKRVCLILDCLCPHEFSDATADLINLQHYVIREKKLNEKEAILIFSDIVRVVESLHSVSMYPFCPNIFRCRWVMTSFSHTARNCCSIGRNNTFLQPIYCLYYYWGLSHPR
jgi:serine/threonine-protein kinase 40